MKKRFSRELKLLILIFPLFVVFKFFSSAMSEEGMMFSVINKGKTGVSVLYKTIKELDMEVSYSLEDILKSENEKTVIFYKNDGKIENPIENPEVIDMIRKKGKMVVFASLNIQDHVFNLENGELATASDRRIADKFSQGGKILGYRFKIGNGDLILINAAQLVNKTLLREREGAFWLYEILSEKEGSIQFNEKYLFGADAKPNLWREISSNARVICLQILLILICYLLYRGRRFGKRYPYVPEIERVENEYIQSCSSMFYKYKKWDLIYFGFYAHFMEKMQKVLRKRGDVSLDDIEKSWEEKGFENLNLLRKINHIHKKIESSNKNKAKKNKHMFVENIKNIEKLEEYMDKRREKRWSK